MTVHASVWVNSPRKNRKMAGRAAARRVPESDATIAYVQCDGLVITPSPLLLLY